MDEFMRWPKPYLFLLATCDWKLSWVIEIWMKNHLESESNYNSVKELFPQLIYKEWKIMLGWHLVLVTLSCGLQLVLSKTIKIGDTEYHV